MKYFSAKVLAGAVLYRPDTNEALLINTVELYGRTLSVDPHYERPCVSFPLKTARCPNSSSMSNSIPDGLKLIFGAKKLEYLATGSIRIDIKHDHEVGPTTTAFTLDSNEKLKNTKIYQDHDIYRLVKGLGENSDCTCIEPSNSIYQLRQLRSRFEELETYNKMRATSDVLNILNDQLVMIYTL